MIARAGQSAHPYKCAHVKVFTDVFTLVLIQSFTRFASHGHQSRGSFVGDRIASLTAFSNSNRLDECHGQTRLESRRLGGVVKSLTS